MVGRATAWNCVIAGGLAVATFASFALYVLGGINARPAEAPRAVALVAGLAALASAVGWWRRTRVRRRALGRFVDAVRRLARGETGAGVDAGGSAELTTLAAALRTLDSRLRNRFEYMDRQRRMLETLVERLQEGVIVADARGRIVLLNPTAARLLNLPHAPEPRGDRWVGQPVEICVPQHAIQSLLCPPDGTLAASDPATDAPPLESSTDDDGEGDGEAIRLEVERPQGSLHVLVWADDIALTPAEPDAVGESRGRVVTLTDTTAVERLIQVKTDFVANASHELRTPLATIRAAVETLLGLDLREEEATARGFLEKIDRHSARLELLVKDLLDLSRLEAPTTRFEPEPLDAPQLLDDLHGRYAERLERKGLRWEGAFRPCANDEARPEAAVVRTIVANPQLLRLVLDNLVDNAIKFTEPGGIVRVTITRNDGEATFEVTDSGCGIPTEDQERVFERFYQVERGRSGVKRGTGLGLSIVRHAVGAMRGSVRLRSAVGVGTTVVVRIPAVPSLT